MKTCDIHAQYFRGFTVVWKRQEQYEMVLVIVLYVWLLYHRNMYWYITRASNTAQK